MKTTMMYFLFLCLQCDEKCFCKVLQGNIFFAPFFFFWKLSKLCIFSYNLEQHLEIYCCKMYCCCCCCWACTEVQFILFSGSKGAALVLKYPFNRQSVGMFFSCCRLCLCLCVH